MYSRAKEWRLKRRKSKEEYAIAFRKDDETNGALDEIMWSPKYQELVEKYIIEK